MAGLVPVIHDFYYPSRRGNLPAFLSKGIRRPMTFESHPRVSAADVIIRTVVEADLPSVHGMAIALAAFHGESCALTLDSLVRDAAGDEPWVSLFVAEFAGDCVAYAALNPLVRLATGQRGMELQHLFVEARARGQGVGTRLLEAGIDFARSKGCSYFALSARADNLQAQTFYSGRGFQVLPQKNLRYILSL
jgi:ribosomal protein S18 acetylase RimI-like enzyme